MRRPVEARVVEVEIETVLATYGRWLDRQPLTARTQEAYRAQVKGFVLWLAGSEHGAKALSVDTVRNWALRDYVRHLKQRRRWDPASVTQALGAINNFYHSLGMTRDS